MGGRRSDSDDDRAKRKKDREPAKKSDRKDASSTDKKRPRDREKSKERDKAGETPPRKKNKVSSGDSKKEDAKKETTSGNKEKASKKHADDTPKSLRADEPAPKKKKDGEAAPKKKVDENSRKKGSDEPAKIDESSKKKKSADPAKGDASSRKKKSEGTVKVDENSRHKKSEEPVKADENSRKKKSEDSGKKKSEEPVKSKTDGEDQKRNAEKRKERSRSRDRARDKDNRAKAPAVDMAEDPEVLAAASAATASAAAKVDRVLAAALGKDTARSPKSTPVEEKSKGVDKGEMSAKKKDDRRESQNDTQAKESKSGRGGPTAARDEDSISASRSRSVTCSVGASRSRSPRQRRDDNGLRGAQGFGVKPSDAEAEALSASVSSGAAANTEALAVLPASVKGLLDNREGLFQDVLRLKQAVEVAQTPPMLPSMPSKPQPKEELGETVLKMPSRLQEALLHPDNEPRLLARCGLLAAAQSEDGNMVLRAVNKKELNKALSQLRRIAYHCQWGCNKQKVTALLADKPAKSATSIVVRLASTSSRLQSHEERLNKKSTKLRVGTQAGACQLAIEGIPGISRKHCTITFEPEKAACYVQDLSTNGTYLNGKKLPRPPYKNPQDARVRLFHGDELFFRLRSEDSEELGFVVNILELS